MSDIRSHIPFYERSYLFQLAVSLIVVLGAGIILYSAFTGAGLLIFGAKIDLLENPSNAVNKEEIAFLRYMLITQDISLFIVPAIILPGKMKPIHHRGFMASGHCTFCK